ncbi:MAG: site-specific integrase [Deltaproteobacteria bacterium]|nr:site-specific integrase [Deltaproteobacteria bacterium]
MDKPLVKQTSSLIQTEIDPRVQQYRQASLSWETQRALEKNLKKFSHWSKNKRIPEFPIEPSTMESFLAFLAEGGLKAASIEQAKWALDTVHRMAGLPAPGLTSQVKATLSGIKRTHGSRQSSKDALTIEHIRLLPFDSSPKSLRNKALLLLGFAGGFRRSELAGIQVNDLAFSKGGVQVLLQFSKSDQEGKGEWVHIVPSHQTPLFCPVKALESWLGWANLREGAVFRSISRQGVLGPSLSTVSIGIIIKQAAQQCGFDPARFGGHSLRAGCATYLLEQSVPLNMVAKHLRHKRADTTLRYDRNQTSKALKGVY